MNWARVKVFKRDLFVKGSVTAFCPVQAVLSSRLQRLGITKRMTRAQSQAQRPFDRAEEDASVCLTEWRQVGVQRNQSSSRKQALLVQLRRRRLPPPTGGKVSPPQPETTEARRALRRHQATRGTQDAAAREPSRRVK